MGQSTTGPTEVEWALSNLESAVSAARHYHDRCSVGATAGDRRDYEAMIECVADATYRAEVLRSALSEALR